MKEFIKKLLQTAKEQNLEAEAYALMQDSITSKANGKERTDFSANATQAVGLRVLHNGKMGYASTEAFDDEAIEMLIHSAKESALYNETEDIEQLYQGAASYASIDHTVQNAPLASPQVLFAACDALNDEILAVDARIQKVSHIAANTSMHKKIIANTHGMWLENENAVHYMYAYAHAQEAEDMQVGGSVAFARDFNTLNIKKLAKECANEALVILNGKKVQSGMYNIIFKNTTMSALLAVFEGIFSAETMQKGLSLLQGKENTKIASEVVNLQDAPLLADAFQSTNFDDEGMPTQNKMLIQNGIFTTALHNLKTAQKAGVQSTGNAGKQGVGGSIAVQSFNLHFQNGAQSFEELLQSMGEGIVICDLAGLHAGANPISGDFSLAAKGYMVINGKKEHAVSQITVSGNFYTLLQQIQAFANDLRFPEGGNGSPSCFVGKLAVAGK